MLRMFVGTFSDLVEERLGKRVVDKVPLDFLKSTPVPRVCTLTESSKQGEAS